jgi:hypothetical protein
MRRDILWILGLCLLVPGFIVAKFGVEYQRAYQASEEKKQATREFALIDSALDRFVELNGRLPNSLSDLKLSLSPISVAQFRYVNDTNGCFIGYSSAKVHLAHPHYSGAFLK